VPRKASYHRLRSGATWRLELPLQGDPPPQARWLRNGYPLDKSRSGSSQGAILVLSQVTGQDSGTYSCHVSNVAGSVLWEEATLRVDEQDGEGS